MSTGLEKVKKFLMGELEDGLILGTNGTTGWDADGRVGVDCFPVDGKIIDTVEKKELPKKSLTNELPLI